MFINYLKIAFRNFWKNKRYSVVNIAGLALSLTCFILVILYVQNQLSYDKWNPLANRIYQVNIGYTESDLSTEMALKAMGEMPKAAEVGTTTPSGLGPVLKEKVPEVEAYNRFYMDEWGEKLVTLPDNRKVYLDDVVGVDSTFFSVFPYPFLYGHAAHALDRPNDMVLSYETAKKLFGNKNPVGETIRLNNKAYYTITGVMNKPATPTSMHINAAVRMKETSMPWGYKWYFTYVLLRPGSSPKEVAAKMTKVLARTPGMSKNDFENNQAKIMLTPLPQLYLHPATDNQPGNTGNPTLLSILFLMALLILIVSCINFTNLSIAQAGSRAREVGVRKVLGSSRFKISLHFLGETFMQCLIGIFIALMMTELLLPAVNNTLGLSLTLFGSYYSEKLFLYLLLALILVSVVSGIYPALFLSGYQPAKVLKGNFSRGAQGNLFRKGLVVFQFVIAAGFIIIILIINRQFQFLRYRDVGFDPQQVMDIRIHDRQTERSFPFIKQRLLQLANVKAVTRVNYQPGSHGMEHANYSVDDAKMEFDEVHIDYDYFKTLGIDFLAGRGFSLQYTSDSSNIIINEAIAEKYHLKDSVGSILTVLKNIGTVRLIGIVPNYNQRGANSKIQPMAFFLGSTPLNNLASATDDRNHVLIRMNLQNVAQTVQDIKTIWKEAEPDYPIQYSFLDQQFASYFHSMVRLGRLVSIFTLVALLITLFGLFSLAALTAEQRTKEIGIRKVLGADTRNILMMLNRQFIGLILLGNIIAWPLCFILMKKWLNNFNYRINIPVMPFIVATASTFLLCIFIVSMQAWRAARANPVEALKYE